MTNHYFSSIRPPIKMIISRWSSSSFLKHGLLKHRLLKHSLAGLLVIATAACSSGQSTELSLNPSPTSATQEVALSDNSQKLPIVLPSAAAIASAHELATKAGKEILADGGNAFDAAIAVAATLGVVEPYSAGLGGGGFWLLYQADEKQYRFIDARETAPAAAGKDYYLDAQGNVDRQRAINGPTAAAIPGQPAAFVYLAEKYGMLPLSRSLQPAIRHARLGFKVSEIYQRWLGYRLPVVQSFPDSARIFLKENDMPALNSLIEQRNLAETLEALAEFGHDGFYRGPVADTMVKAVRKNGGDWTLEDLASYQVKERQPIQLAIGDQMLISAPPPSSGGVALAQMLTMLRQLDDKYGPAISDIDELHRLVEVMRRAYRDRAEFLGDPDFVDVPVEQLLNESYLAEQVASVNLTKATDSLALGGSKNVSQGFHTTHLSVIDADGNRVSATLSINLPFGSGFVAGSSGVLLNNEMDDFSAKPGEANAYGLVGNEANAIAPGKRPLSSMTPTMLESPDQVAILGTPGGSRIITMVLLGLLEQQQGKPVTDWVSRPRIHHQYLPDQIQYEPGALTEQQQQALAKLGHELKNVNRRYGNMQAIAWDIRRNIVTAAADPRGEGFAEVIPVSNLGAFTTIEE